MVVHDSSGVAIACGLVQQENVEGPKVAIVSPVLGSRSNVLGLLEVYEVKEGVRFIGSVSGFRDTNPWIAVAVHSGRNCTARGGRFFDGDHDPFKYLKFGKRAGNYQSVLDDAGNLKLNFTVRGYTLNGVHDVDGRVVVLHNSSDAEVGCGIIGQAAGAHAASAMLDTPPSYDGEMVVRGVVSVLPSPTLETGITLRGYITGVPKNRMGGVHIHEGISCASIGGHYRILSSYGNYADPWKKVKWMSGEDQRLAQDCPNDACAVHFIYNVESFTLDTTRPVIRRALVVHDTAGTAVACGVIKPEKMSGPKVAVISAIDGSGSFVTGMLEFFSVREGLLIRGVVDGLEPNAVESLAVHEGYTCTDRGERYFDGEFDPWTLITYKTDERGTAELNRTVKGFTFDGVHAVFGRVVVVSDSKGVQVGCGVITSPFKAPEEEDYGYEVPTTTMTVQEKDYVYDEDEEGRPLQDFENVVDTAKANNAIFEDRTSSSTSSVPIAVILFAQRIF
jgi:Cu/Zn superoxide dismutase